MWRIWIAALFWGLNWPAVKLALAGFSPWTLRAVGLGLGQQASGLVATFALMSSLIDVPLAGEVPSQMERELAAFVDTLRERRRLVENLQQARELLAPMPRPARRSWRQIVDT